LVGGTVVGCTEGQVCRNVYEGARMQRNLEIPPNERSVDHKDVTNNQHRVERKRAIVGPKK